MDQEGPVFLDNSIFLESRQLERRGSREFNSQDDLGLQGLFLHAIGIGEEDGSQASFRPCV